MHVNQGLTVSEMLLDVGGLHIYSLQMIEMDVPDEIKVLQKYKIRPHKKRVQMNMNECK